MIISHRFRPKYQLQYHMNSVFGLIHNPIKGGFGARNLKALQSYEKNDYFLFQLQYYISYNVDLS